MRKLLRSPPLFLNFSPREGAGPVLCPLRRPWWVGLMAVRGLLRLLGLVQPGPGAALVAVAAAPAASDGWHRLVFGVSTVRFLLLLLLLSLVPWPRTPLPFSPHSRLYVCFLTNTPPPTFSAHFHPV